MRFFKSSRLFLIVFLFCIAAKNAHAKPSYVDRCPRHQVETILKSKLAKTQVFGGETGKFTEYAMGHSRGDSRILGFVEYKELGTQFKGDFEYVKLDDKRTCVKLTKVIGYFYAAPKIFLPTDYKKGSCEYEQVLKHEKRHLQAVYDFHDKYTDKYRAYLGQIARSVPIPYPALSREEITEHKEAIMNYFVEEFMKLETQSLEELMAIQAKIDSPQEYYGVSKRCDKW